MAHPRTTALALVAVAGVTTSLGYAPVEQPFFTLLGVALYIVVCASTLVAASSRRFMLLVGVLFAVSFMAPLIWWMNAVSHGAYATLVFAEVVLMAPLALSLRWASRRRMWPLWGSAVWVTFEALRSSFPFSGFPWGRLAHATVDTPFAAFTRYIGPAATSAVVFLAAACVASLVLYRTRRAIAISIAAFVALASVGALLPTGLASPAGTREVALIQGDVPGPAGTWPRGEIFRMHLQATARLAADIQAGVRPQPDFVIWPENGMDIDPHADPAAAAALTQMVKDVGAPILVGGILDGPTPTTAYNAGFVWTEQGEEDRYIKRNLVPYGEYVPFRQVIGDLVPQFDREIPRDMLPGDQPGDLAIADITLGDAICWDVAYDSAIRDVINNGAQILTVQTSNASFTGTSQPDQQWQISRLRAIETGRYILVPSTNGISGIADAHGKTLVKAPIHQPAIISMKVSLADGTTLGVRIGKWLEWLLIAATVAAMAATVVNKRQMKRSQR
ncbi:apolipoprotein N-acyltransferase [soil metagenome]